MQQLRYSAKLVLYKKDKFFGPGIVRLLRLVEQTHSLHEASKQMSLAYTKALKMIKTAESDLGFKLVEKRIGGKRGGGSDLTINALAAIEAYVKFNTKVKSAAEVGFEEYKKDIEKMR